MIMSIHNLTIIKRTKDSQPPNPTRANYVEADSKATCSCGWSSDWQPTEQLAREEYGRHKFMSVKSPFLHFERDWPV